MIETPTVKKETPQSGFVISLLVKLAFVAFGIGTFAHPLLGFKIYNLVFAVLAGLLFGFLCKKFLSFFLGAVNSGFKAQWGKKIIRVAVERGFLFLVPFAVMALTAVFYLGWNYTPAFVSAGLMTSAAAANMELNRLKEKKDLKSTITAAVVAWVFSTLWLVSAGFLGKIPLYAEGLVNLLKMFTGGRMG